MEISNELRKLIDPNNECCCEHSLSNKCKVWAWNNNYGIEEKVNGAEYYCLKDGVCEYIENKDSHNLYSPIFTIQACEEILKKVKQVR